jgi:hypothetical protein
MLTASLNTNKETNNDLTIHHQAFQHWFHANLRLELGFATFLTFELYYRNTNTAFFALLSCVLATMFTGPSLFVCCLKNWNILKRVSLASSSFWLSVIKGTVNFY